MYVCMYAMALAGWEQPREETPQLYVGVNVRVHVRYGACGVEETPHLYVAQGEGEGEG